jgi:hypothetical protein
MSEETKKRIKNIEKSAIAFLKKNRESKKDCFVKEYLKRKNIKDPTLADK